MKAAMFAVSAMILFTPLSLADEEWFDPFTGGAPRPMAEHPSVQMVSEDVLIKLGRRAAEVACKFVFRNTGEAVTVTMGFPENRSKQEGFRGYDYFRTRVDGKQVATQTTRWEPDGEVEGEEWRYRTKKVFFAKNQTRAVEDFYGVRTTTDPSEGGYFWYNLVTGTSWQGPIEKAVITADISGISDCQTIWLSPDSYVREGDEAKWIFTDFEPNRNIHITYMVHEYCNFVVDGREMNRRPTEYYPPVRAWIDNGVLMVPMGYVRGLVQPSLMWSYADRVVTMTDGAKTLRLTVGSTSADVDGAPLELPRAPEIRQSTCILPLAPVARALGATVWFDPDTKKTHITRPE